MRRLSINDTEPGATGPYYFCQLVMGGASWALVDYGGHLDIHNEIPNTDFCYVIERCNCYAWYTSLGESESLL